MKALLIMLLALILSIAPCSFCLAASPAASPMQSVGEEFGQTWLTQNSNKFVISSTNNSNDLWKWGGKPRGYDVFLGKLYPLLAPTEVYYPGFMANATPIIVNGTALMRNQRSLYMDFMSQDFMSDPWLLAQMTERPVMVVYPADDRRSTLL